MRRTRLLHFARPFSLVPIASALLACSAQVDSDNPGEPIATMHGVVKSSAALGSVPELSAAIVWFTTEAGGEPRYIIGERIAVDNKFPASFSLNLYGPPPPEAELATMNAYCIHPNGELDSIDAKDSCDGQIIPVGTGVGQWSGYLAAIDARVPEGEITRDDILGIDVDHVINYFDHARPYEPKSSMPTAKEVAWQLGLVSTDYPMPNDAGYMLGKTNPKYRALQLKHLDCLWANLCVHWTRDASFLRSQDRADWEFERCQERFPENPTCSAFGEPVADDEPASSVECRERYESLVDVHDCSYSHSLEEILKAPDGLADPITIQLGRGYWDAAP